MKQNNHKKPKKFIIKLAVLLFWIGVWQGAFMIVNKQILIASPAQVCMRFFELCTQASFWQSVLVSMLRISAGFLSGVVLGVILAVLTSASSFLNELFYPLLSLVRATPVASFIILALVWIKKDFVPVFIVILIVLPVVWANVCQGINATDKTLLESAKVFGFGKLKTVKTVYFHSVLPSFAAGSTTALGLAWKSGVAAEVLSKPTVSIGYHLYRSQINIETADLFVWTAVVIIFSVLLEKLIKLLLKKGAGLHDKN